MGVINIRKLMEGYQPVLGKWKADVNMGGNFVLTIAMEIIDSEDSVSGTLSFTPSGQESKLFNIMGIFKDGVLIFLYIPEDDDKTSRGAVTLKLEKDGTVLDGVFAYYSQERDVVDSLRTTFHRV